MAKRKNKNRSRTNNQQRRTQAPPMCEWVGGLVETPFFVGQENPYRPQMMLWIELPERLVIHSALLEPDQPGLTFRESLQIAMEEPLIGPARQPDAIRVADKTLVAQIRPEAGEIPIRVAPTPELQQFMREMAENMPIDRDTELSYMESEHLTAELIGELFDACKPLHEQAPWKNFGEEVAIRVDIPSLGLEGACLTLIGEMDQARGFVIFPSMRALEAFSEATQIRQERGGPIDLGTSALGLHFDRGSDLPPSMLREAMTHAWPVASPEAYPTVVHHDRDGIGRPLTKRDVQVVIACTRSLTAFSLKHGEQFRAADCEPVCETYQYEDDPPVRLTVPFEAEHLFVVNNPSRPDVPPGDEHLRHDPETVHELDGPLVMQMNEWALTRFGNDWFKRALIFEDFELTAQLGIPWSVFHARAQKRTVCKWYLQEMKNHLTGPEREWLMAQDQAWLTVLDVLEVEPGQNITFADTLTFATSTVVEKTASETLRPGDMILGRIVNHQGTSHLCGMYPFQLPLFFAEPVIAAVRKRLRLKRAIQPERLRKETIGRLLIQRWEQAVEEFHHVAALTPDPDEETDVYYIDEYIFDPAVQATVEAGLTRICRPRQGRMTKMPSIFELDYPGDPTKLLGNIDLAQGALRIELESIADAELAKGLLVLACGPSLMHRTRSEHLDDNEISEEESAKT